LFVVNPSLGTQVGVRHSAGEGVFFSIVSHGIPTKPKIALSSTRGS